MQNSSLLVSNMTEVSVYRTFEATRTSLFTLLLLLFLSFLYFIKILFRIYLSNAHIRDNARYLLFFHMLINDSMYLFLGLLLMTLSIYVVFLPLLICYVLVTVTLTSYVVTPFNLAVMSLERYIAVCHPLRHAELCTEQKSCVAIIAMWILGLLPNIADIVIMGTSIEKNTLLFVDVTCNSQAVTMTPLQDQVKSFNVILSLSLVGLIILSTYVKVVMVARKAGGSSASKAGKTVMLHAFQLFLCMTSLTSSFLERKYNSSYYFLRTCFFIVFMFLPRFLSPLIYGLRDEMFRKNIKKMYSK